jgi:hypothetical protein
MEWFGEGLALLGWVLILACVLMTAAMAWRFRRHLGAPEQAVMTDAKALERLTADAMKFRAMTQGAVANGQWEWTPAGPFRARRNGVGFTVEWLVAADAETIATVLASVPPAQRTVR